MPKSEQTLSEDELLKALDSFESSLAKGGDALQNAPHDGGLATEGTNIQSKAEAKKAIAAALVKAGHKNPDDILKMLSASDMGSDEDEDDDNDGEGPGDSDEGEDDAPPPPPMAKGKVKKSTGAAALQGATQAGSSIIKAMDADDDTREMVDVQPFLKKLVEAIAASDDSLRSGVARLVKGLGAQQSQSNNFQKSVAQAFVLMSNRLDDLQNIVKKMADQPVPGGRTPTVRKGDIQNPDFNSDPNQLMGREDANASPLLALPVMKIQNELVDMAMKGHVDIMDVTKYENSNGNLGVLPPNVVKSLEAKLCPAA